MSERGFFDLDDIVSITLLRAEFDEQAQVLSQLRQDHLAFRREHDALYSRFPPSQITGADANTKTTESLVAA